MPTPHNFDQSDAYAIHQHLPEPLPPDPWGVFRTWWNEAHSAGVQPNPNAMTLATVDPGGRPSARIVLCKLVNLEPDAGYLVFFTNRESRKGLALGANPRAALVLHWDDLDRQVRIEGRVLQSPDAESDAYFASRPLESRLGAWASHQSRPIASRQELLVQVAHTAQRLGITLGDEKAQVPRPAHWGGYRVWADAVELWVGGPGRVHDRARWERSLAPNSAGFRPGPWTSTRLQP